MSRTPFSGFMGGGSRQPQGGGQQPPPRAPYGGGDSYQQQQGYGARYNDPRGQQQPPQGYQGGGGQPRYAEKGPSGGGRQVPLRVEKVTDKSLQSRLIYGNLYVGAFPNDATQSNSHVPGAPFLPTTSLPAATDPISTSSSEAASPPANTLFQQSQSLGSPRAASVYQTPSDHGLASP